MEVAYMSLHAECTLVAQGPTELVGIIGGGDPAGVVKMRISSKRVISMSPGWRRCSVSFGIF